MWSLFTRVFGACVAAWLIPAGSRRTHGGHTRVSHSAGEQQFLAADFSGRGQSAPPSLGKASFNLLRRKGGRQSGRPRQPVEQVSLLGGLFGPNKPRISTRGVRCGGRLMRGESCQACSSVASGCNGDCSWLDGRCQKNATSILSTRVSCGGGRRAAFCHACGSSESTCKGDCYWRSDRCQMARLLPLAKRSDRQCGKQRAIPGQFSTPEKCAEAVLPSTPLSHHFMYSSGDQPNNCYLCLPEESWYEALGYTESLLRPGPIYRDRKHGDAWSRIIGLDKSAPPGVWNVYTVARQAEIGPLVYKKLGTVCEQKHAYLGEFDTIHECAINFVANASCSSSSRFMYGGDDCESRHCYCCSGTALIHTPTCTRAGAVWRGEIPQVIEQTLAQQREDGAEFWNEIDYFFPPLWHSKVAKFCFEDTDKHRVNHTNKNQILFAMQQITQAVDECIRFQPVDDCTEPGTIMIRTAYQKDACAAWPDGGMIFVGGCSTQSLEHTNYVWGNSDYVWGNGPFVHELMHALGRHHEGGRPDAPRFPWRREDSWRKFLLLSNSTDPVFNVAEAYDYVSVTHQHRLRPDQIGQLSNTDSELLARMYGCQARPNTIVGLGCRNLDSEKTSCTTTDGSQCSDLQLDGCCVCGGGVEVTCYKNKGCPNQASFKNQTTDAPGVDARRKRWARFVNWCCSRGLGTEHCVREQSQYTCPSGDAKSRARRSVVTQKLRSAANRITHSRRSGRNL